MNKYKSKTVMISMVFLVRQ